MTDEARANVIGRAVQVTGIGVGMWLWQAGHLAVLAGIGLLAVGVMTWLHLARIGEGR